MSYRKIWAKKRSRWYPDVATLPGDGRGKKSHSVLWVRGYLAEGASRPPFPTPKPWADAVTKQGCLLNLNAASESFLTQCSRNLPGNQSDPLTTFASHSLSLFLPGPPAQILFQTITPSLFLPLSLPLCHLMGYHFSSVLH